MGIKVQLLFITASLVACDDDPSSPQVNQLNGEWEYTAQGLTGGGLTCDVRDVALVMSESGGAVSGSTTGGTMVCSAGGAFSDPLPLDPGTVTGTVDGTTVRFDVTQGPNLIQNSAPLSFARLEGTVNSMIDFGEPAGVVISSGTFTAARR